MIDQEKHAIDFKSKSRFIGGHLASVGWTAQRDALNSHSGVSGFWLLFRVVQMYGGKTMDKIGAIVAAVGGLFAIYLVLAAAIEAILEALQPVIGVFNPFKRKVPFDQALKLVEQIKLDDNQKDKPAAIKDLLNGLAEHNATIKKKLDDVTSIANKASAGSADAIVGGLAIDAIKEEVDGLSQRRRSLHRLLAALIGILAAWQTGIDSFQLLSEVFPAFQDTGKDASARHIAGYIVTGFAASAGSAFWHDQLMRVESLRKQVQGVMPKVP